MGTTHHRAEVEVHCFLTVICFVLLLRIGMLFSLPGGFIPPYQALNMNGIRWGARRGLPTDDYTKIAYDSRLWAAAISALLRSISPIAWNWSRREDGGSKGPNGLEANCGATPVPLAVFRISSPHSQGTERSETCLFGLICKKGGTANGSSKTGVGNGGHGKEGFVY